ncbi:conserved membrane hypothetical protein [Vibrio chagasii]|uniref:hypothetical protein n=1 Tax=Vibrio TaxID=662 RepID=UPI001493CE43|nr:MULTISPECIES: hypothetical protein [Vibrio]MCG9562571.1 hypothetical protein [Vibrio chagasii]MCG9565298.1 hypothetical protein [Vibrio chagasii]MCG9673983.1 hypothetical protein [Vibrio chagasii]NOI84115.1 hypothetical protein [Vibrio sp. 99K-1]CAH6784300.1 conserved membrane hypothetical protein [Vibrio chagasii]
MFFNRFLKPFLVNGGLVTMYAGIYAINPETALHDMNNLPYDSNYVFLFRHWGIMVGLMGFFIAASAYVRRWRESIILYSFLEKLFMVYLFVSNFFNPETAHLNASFIPFAITDITICTYTLGYWYENYKLRKTVSA